MTPLTTPYYIALDTRTKENEDNPLSHQDYQEYIQSLTIGERHGINCNETPLAYFRGKRLICKKHYAVTKTT